MDAATETRWSRTGQLQPVVYLLHSGHREVTVPGNLDCLRSGESGSTPIPGEVRGPSNPYMLLHFLHNLSAASLTCSRCQHQNPSALKLCGERCACLAAVAT